MMQKSPLSKALGMKLTTSRMALEPGQISEFMSDMYVPWVTRSNSLVETVVAAKRISFPEVRLDEYTTFRRILQSMSSGQKMSAKVDGAITLPKVAPPSDTALSVTSSKGSDV